MRLLELGPTDGPVLDCAGYDWLISRNYRHILKRDVLDRFPGRAINMHISFLPYNRGADPNLWAAVDNTKSGVTIHAIDEGIDTGPIYAQREIVIGDDETLASSYEKLQRAMDALWLETWPLILNGLRPTPQVGRGTYHRKADRPVHLLTRGWETRVGDLRRARTPSAPR